MMSGPIRSVWLRASGTGAASKSGWRNLGPMVFSAFAIFATFSFFTQFIHPLGHVDAAKTNIPSPQDTVYSMNFDGTGQTRLNVTPGKFGWFGVPSPDGSLIAYSVGIPNSVGSEVYVMNSDGSNPTQITTNGSSNWYPSWSPDGKQIAFISSVGGSNNVYVVGAQGGTPKAVTHSDAPKWGTTWTPDGKQIAFTMQNDGIFLVDADGGDPARLASTGSGDSGPAWSPDGTQIAFSHTENDATSIYLMNADGSGIKKLTDKSQNPQWLPDGRLVFSTWRNGQFLEIYAINADGRDPVNLTNDSGKTSYLPMVSAKTNKIIYTAHGFDFLPSWLTERAGAGAIMFQSAIMMGVLLLLIRRWQLPFGAITLIVGLTALLLATNSDLYPYVPGAVIAALLADMVLKWMGTTIETPGRFYLFAFVVPVIFYALYFLTMALTPMGIAWTIHLWLGAISLAGIVGLFVSFLVILPFSETQALI